MQPLGSAWREGDVGPDGEPVRTPLGSKSPERVYAVLSLG